MITQLQPGKTPQKTLKASCKIKLIHAWIPYSIILKMYEVLTHVTNTNKLQALL